MFIIKGEWKYVLVKADMLSKSTLEKIYNKKSWPFVEMSVEPNTFYIFEKQKGTINKQKWLDIIDMELLSTKKSGM